MASKIRILHPVLHYPPIIGGMEQWIENIAEHQPDSIEVFVVTGRVKGYPARKQGNNYFIYRDSPVRLNSLHSSYFYIFTALPFIFFRSLYFVKKNKIDILHCHGFLSSFMGYLTSRITKVPYISTEQGLMGANRGIIFSASNFLRGVVYRNASSCVASSRAVAEDFYKLGVAGVELIPNGVDFYKFMEARKSKKSNEFTILSVGRLEKVKGHSYLVESFGHIKNKIPDARLVIVGDGSEYKNIKKQVYDSGLSDSVELAGSMPHDKLPEFFARADTFVMPSLLEGFGITAIEAMASGVPLIASNVGSLREIVEADRDGMLVPAGNADEITRAVLFIYENPQKARILADNAIEKAKKYSWDSVALRVSHLYESTI